MRYRFAWIVFAGVVSLGGCGPADFSKGLYPLTGTLTQDGKPVTGGRLSFAPAAGGWGGVTVDASVNKDGTFFAQTSKWSGTETVLKPGLKPGRYKVIYHPPSDGQKTGLEVELPGIVEVETKENSIQLELPLKLPEGNGQPRDDANPPAEKKD